MIINITSIKTSSDGVWQGDNPLDYAFPLLIVQTALILAVSRFLAFLLKPFRQPTVIAEITGGILLGPSALGRNQVYLNRIFPTWSTPILESVASIGLLFFLFLVGLELDLRSIRRSGRRALGIATAGISLPFVCGVGVAFVLRKSVDGADKASYGPFLVFIGVALSITAFPVLARILAELRLLTTPVGETAMAAAAFNDVAAWILLALAVALAGDGDCGGHKSPLISVWVLLCGLAFATFMMLVIRPAMSWVARRSQEDSSMDEVYICSTLAGVMVSGFITDMIGIHSIFGAFMFGLTIPKGVFVERLIERIEDFVTGLLLPLYFASSGLKTNVATIKGLEAWGLLALVITTACAGKIIGTFTVAMMCMISARESLTLGVLMNTKGLVELIVLNIGKEKKVLNDEMFAILVLMSLFATFLTTPIAMTIYKSVHGGSTLTCRRLDDFSKADASKYDLRILACFHDPGNVSSLISLIDGIRCTKKSLLKLYAMRLVELTERPSSIIMVHRVRKNGFPFTNRLRRSHSHDRVEVAFEAYRQLGRVSVRSTTAISSLPTMHEDICHVAEEKRVAMVILPFHKQWKGKEDEEEIENLGEGWRGVNQRVLKNSPCSVAVLIDRGFGTGPQQTTGRSATTVSRRICILFLGGPDDREALQLGARMAEHPTAKVTAIRFVEDDAAGSKDVILQPSQTKCINDQSYNFSTVANDRRKEKELDENATVEFKSSCLGLVEFVEKVASDIVAGVLALGKSGEYDLVVVGKGRFPSRMMATLADQQAEHAELGPIGDILSAQGIVSSVLVVQQYDMAHAEEVPVSKVLFDATTASGVGPSTNEVTHDFV